MAWRFKVSKYKNAVGLVPRKEDWLTDIRVGSPQSFGNHIKASAAFMAFSVMNRGGGSLGVVPLHSKGRFDSNSPLLHAHSDLITDFDFSPFDDGMLATGSTDANVHIWHIPENGLESSLSTPCYSVPQFDKRVENVLFHPTTEFILTVSYYDTVKLWDILHEKELHCCRGPSDQVQSTSWKADGSLLVTNARDRIVRVHDPRADCVVIQADSHPSPKDSRVVWMGSTDTLLTTGYSRSRVRELCLRDVRSFNKPYKTQTFDSSTGILMPLYDADTRMLFLIGKADVGIMYWEVADKEPFLTEGLKHNGSVQTKGACMVPKRGVDAMAGEINRVLQLTANAVIPITYQVPRKTFREFHSDLFPRTPGSCSAATVQHWMSGGSEDRATVSLDPGHRTNATLQMHRGRLSDRVDCVAPDPTTTTTTTTGTGSSTSSGATNGSGGAPVPAPRSRPNTDTAAVAATKTHDKRVVTLTKPTVAVKKNESECSEKEQRSSSNICDLMKAIQGGGIKRDNNDTTSYNDKNEARDNRDNSQDRQEMASSKLASLRAQFESRGSSCELDGTNNAHNNDNNKEDKIGNGVSAPLHPPSSPSLQRRNLTTRTRSFRRICKFRHLKGTPGHRSTHLDNLRDLSRATPGESDGIACNSLFVVLPLAGAGGKVSVLQHAKGGRQPDGVVPALLSGANVLDFALDPFDDYTLLTACDDGKILKWCIPAGGLITSSNEPHAVYCDSTDKVTLLKYHPLASGVVAAVCGDFSVRIWDLDLGVVVITLDQHPDQVFSCAWSPCGVYLATLCRDGMVRVFDPRKSAGPCREGPGPTGVRGGRVLWALDGDKLVTTGASKSSQREVSVYSSSDLSAPLTTLPLDQSPAILMPHLDADSNTLFITAKGESSIFCYEVGPDFPHLFPLSHHKAASVHQGLTFLPKHTCDVRAVEFARALRLTHTVLEPLSFTVPRVKTALFQDDLFPQTVVSWQSCLASADWCAGSNATQPRVSLQPEDMDTLSGSRVSPPSGAAPASPPFMPPTTPLSSCLPEHVRRTQDKLQHSMSEQISVSSVLEQDSVEGVDTTEWLE